MNLLDLVLIAFALTSSAFAMALVAHVQKCLTLYEKTRLAGLFTIMPAALLWFGYWIGYFILSFMKWSNEWVFVILLFIIGMRMLLRSLKTSPDNLTYSYGKFRVVFALSIALALPALMIGIGFAFTSIDINIFLIPMLGFGLVLSLSGMLIGKRTGKYSLGTKATFFGGAVLVGIALKHVIYLFELI